MAPSDHAELSKEFHETVNMSAKELEKWLDDPQSMETGLPASDGEPKGATRVSAKNRARIL